MKLNKSQIIIFHYFQFILIFLVGLIELEIFNRESYFSDSQNYYEASGVFPPGINEDGYNFVYLLSFMRTKVSYKVSIAILFTIYLFLSTTYILIKKKYIYSLILFHPFVVFAFIRGMKESLMILVILLFVILVQNKIIYFIRFLLLAFVLSLFYERIRPVGDLFILTALVLTLISYLFKSKTRYLLTVIFAFIFVSPLFRDVLQNFVPRIKDQISVLYMSGYEVQYTNLFFLPGIRFIFGPTPIKPILDIIYPNYEFSTPLTLYVLFTGSIYSIYLFIYLFKRRNNYIYKLHGYFGIYLYALHTIAYIIIQDGSVDTRQRAISFFYLIMLIDAQDK